MKRIIFISALLFIFPVLYCQTENLRAQQYYNRAMDKVYRNDHAGAIADFSEAVRLDSGFIEAYENRGVAKYYLEDYEGALKDYDKALEINPDDYNTYVRRGWARFRLKDFTGAVADFNKAIEGDPDEPGYYVARGEVKYKLQDYTGALADFDKVINSLYSGRRNKSEAYFWRGLVHIDKGEKEIGCSDLRRSSRMGHLKASEVCKALCE